MSQTALTVTIEKLVQGGRGLAHHEGQVVFVPGVIPAETVSVAMGARRRGVQEAAVQAVLTPSPERIQAPCPVYGQCGGCQFQHIRYESQLALKAQILRETLARIGKLEVQEVLPVLPSPNPYGYRNTIRFAIFRQGPGFALGMHRQGTVEPVEASGCLLIPEPMRAVIGQIAGRLASQVRLPGRVERMEVRWSWTFAQALLAFETTTAQASQAERVFDLFRDLPAVIGQVITSEESGRRQGRWVDGRDWLQDRLDGVTFRISNRSFAQANWLLTERLVQVVRDWVGAATGEDRPVRILELYSGIGTLGLPLARHGALVTEVEANRYALADARFTARTNHIGRSRFRPVLAEALLEQGQPGEYDVALVDPPRAGLSTACLQGLLALGSPRLLYLSCDAPTLARDVGRLAAGGYRVARVQPLDMFPQTAHLETLVELVR